MSNFVIVTGGDGQIATALKELNSDLCYEFCCRDVLDISDPQAVGDYFEGSEPRMVINTAAYTAVDGAEENSERAYRVNTLGPECLAIACANSMIPLVHLSTDYVFNGDSARLYTEDARVCPLGTYGKTKLGGEERVKALLNEHVILRVSGVFSGHADCFPRSILRAALTRSELKVVSDQITGPTSASSIALIVDLMVRKALAGQLNWGTYHFSQQPFLSWYEFANVIMDIARDMDSRFLSKTIKAVRSNEFSARAPRPLNSRLDSSKLVDELCLDLSVLSREAYLREAIRQITAKI